jgi:ketol-acid reductoisomerase
MDYMYNACSTTARRGALDWAPIFEKANLPVFEKLYESVKNGTETRKSLEFNGRSTYRQDLARELKEIDDQEIWRAGMPSVALGSGFCMTADIFILQARPYGH